MAVDAALHTLNESVDEKKGHVKAAAYIDDIAVMVPSTRANEAEETKRRWRSRTRAIAKAKS